MPPRCGPERGWYTGARGPVRPPLVEIPVWQLLRLPKGAVRLAQITDPAQKMSQLGVILAIGALASIIWRSHASSIAMPSATRV